MRHFYPCAFILLLILSTHVSKAQLAAGDIVFSGYSSDVGSDGFSFIATTAIAAGDSFFITDKGYELAGTLRANEGTFKYVVPSGGLAAGDQVSIEDFGTGTFTASDGGSVTEYGSFNPSITGDQLIAFTGNVVTNSNITVTTYLAALTYNGSGSFENVDPISSNETNLPAGLTLGTDAIAISHRDNGRLTFDTSFLSGTAASIKTRACNSGNWETDNNLIYDLPPYAQNSWNGTAWSSGSNPTSDHNAVISTGQTLTISSALSIAEVSVESGSTLAINDGVTLTLAGDLTNSGTISGTGTISFNNNANISRTRGSVTEFEGTINVESGTTLQTNDLLRLTATSASSYGMLSGDGTVSGNVMIQCYLDLAGGSSDGRWYQLASPVTNTTFADFNESQTLTVSSGSTGTVWQWDAANSAWASPTASSSTVENGRGYTFFTGTNSSVDYIRAEAGTIELTGTVANANVDHALSYNNGQSSSVSFVGGTSSGATEGWNLIGNPYASQYNWSGQTRPSGLNDAIYVYQSDNNFATYIGGVGANNGTQYLAPFQAFWVQTTSGTPGTLTIAASQRVTSQSTELFKTNTIDGIHLKVSTSSNKQDEIFVGFDNNASIGFDGDYDAWKLINGDGVPNLYSQIGQEFFSINRVSLSDLQSFAIGLNYEIHGDPLSINLKNAQLQSYQQVVLEDLKDNITHDFVNGDYSFVNDTTYRSDRFILHFKQSTVSLDDAIATDWYTYTTENGIAVKAPNANDARIEIYNMAGQLVRFKDHFTQEAHFSLQKGSGLYLVKLIEDQKTTTLKIAL